MQQRTVPPAGIGLLAGLLTTAGAIALSATGLLPVWATTPLLFLAGGLAAGLAAPVRPTIGALLGAVTGVFAGVLERFCCSCRGPPCRTSIISPPSVRRSPWRSSSSCAPVYAVAGAVGAAVRPLLRPGPPPWNGSGA